MKYISLTLIATGLLIAAVQSDPLVNRRPEMPKPAMSSQDSLVISQFMPGECCNDDFRQGLPLWETPTDTIIAKP